MELAAGIAGYVLRDSTADRLTETLTESMAEYEVLSTNEVTVMWDLIQRQVRVLVSML